MAKLLKILAVSAGSGLALGLGLKVGESLLPKNLAESLVPPPMNHGDAEARLAALERRTNGALAPTVNSLLESRLSELENRLRKDTEAKQQAILDAFVENVQEKVVNRIAKLEENVSAQASAITELREHSLQTERNIHRLLLGIEKIAMRAPAERSAPESPAPESNGARPKRWFR